MLEEVAKTWIRKRKRTEKEQRKKGEGDKRMVERGSTFVNSLSISQRLNFSSGTTHYSRGGRCVLPAAIVEVEDVCFQLL